MADKKISALTSAATPVAGTEVLPIVQSSTTKQVSIANLTSGRDVAAKSLTVSGESAYGQGKIFTTGAEGLLLQAKTGSFFDAGLLNAAGNAYAWTVAPGTQNMKLWGEATIGNSGVQNHTVFGNLVMASAGKGIDFSATSEAAGMTSELLSDYEEGTFTPVIADASTGGNTGTAEFTFARYTRIGRMVYFNFNIVNANTTGLTAGNNLFVRGLPFAAGNWCNGFSNMTAVTNFTYAGTMVNGEILAGSTNFRFFDVASATGGTLLTVAAILSGSSNIYINGSYEV